MIHTEEHLGCQLDPKFPPKWRNNRLESTKQNKYQTKIPT